MPVKKGLFLLSLCLTLLFFIFSFLLTRGVFTQFDPIITNKLQTNIARFFDLPFSVFSLLGSAEFTSLVWVVIFIFILIKKYWRTTIFLFLFFASILVEFIGKLFVYHPGPDPTLSRGVFHLALPSSTVHTDYSYPSGHMLRTSFLVAFMIGFLGFRSSGRRRLIGQTVLVVLLVLMAVSRIYLGEHWTTDVVGGLLLGLSLGIFTVVTIPIKTPKKES